MAEGTTTEVEYVDAVKQVIRESHTDSVGVKSVGVGRDPEAVLRKAVELRAAAEESGEPYDWCCILVDVDEHTRLAACLARAAQLGVHVVVSNPCFEIWLLWHVEDYRRHCDASELADRLKVHGVAGKHLPARFPFRSYEAAVARAQRADEALASGRQGPNPSSAMPVLIGLMGST